MDTVILFGACLEVIGVFLMAGSYLSGTRTWSRIPILVSALFRGQLANGAVLVSELNRQKRIEGLQGLAFIGLGFLCQAGAMLYKLIA